MSLWCLLCGTILGWRSYRRKWVWMRKRKRRRNKKGRKSRRRRGGLGISWKWCGAWRESRFHRAANFSIEVFQPPEFLLVPFFHLCTFSFSFFCRFELSLKGSRSRPVMMLYHRQQHGNAKQNSACFHKHPSECFFMFKIDFFVVQGSSTLWLQLILSFSPRLKPKSTPALTTLSLEF